ncbi:MAG: polyphosphate polymerase domain-containing protein [Spirochaetales bacterium]|nr:polyphosphate polymerase domain-containing protein [Spirochaetales bacterium]
MHKTKNLSVYRHELKYYISYVDYIRLKEILQNFMRCDENTCGDRGYWIRSLYFDTPDDKEYLEKMMGLERRKKIRLRIYNCDTQRVKLEIKKKFNEYMHKETASITRDEALKLIQGDKNFLLESENTVLQHVYYYMTQEYYLPTVVVDYMRVAFVEHFNNIRITFDHDISACITDFNIFNKDLNMCPSFDAGTIVLEVKYNNFLPNWLKNALSCINTVNSSISKYCYSREACLVNT